MRRSILLPGAVVCCCALLVDQLTKARVRESLDIGQSMHVAGPLYFTHVQNTGAVFGIGQGYILIPTIATVAILAAMPLILRHLSIHYRLVLTRLESVSLGLIAAGAVGNLIDRIFLSAVTDFMHVELAPGLYWPAFNVADMCVVSGTFLLIIAFFRRDARGAVHDDGA